MWTRKNLLVIALTIGVLGLARPAFSDDWDPDWGNSAGEVGAATTYNAGSSSILTHDSSRYLKEDWGEYYWWNEVTNEVDWHPRAVFWQEHQNENGQTYYYNAFTGESTWELPEEAAWEARHSKEHGDHYYWNKVSGKTQWEKPAELAWRRVKVADEGSDEM